uniref:Uncharacterized protein n=1 Tax=Tanacetum cinerariifolium TaxID=118510 RepID=A0A6L2JRX8_TANCI|nr:hypothetical protein [Tanacetum cinerariifolium]
MAISNISISLDSSKESVGTPFRRVLWFGRIPTTMPTTTPTIDPPVIHDDTLLIPIETHTILPITSTIPYTAPTTHYTSPFIHNDSSKEDTPDIPPPTQEIPSVEVAPSIGQILPAPFGVHHIRVTIVSPGHPIPHADHTTTILIGRDSPSNLSSEMTSNSYLDAFSDSSSGHSSLNHSSPALPSSMRSSHQLCSLVSSIPYSSAAITERPSHSSSLSPSHKRSRSLTTSILASLPIPRALSYVCVDLLPPRMRITSSDSTTDLEDCSDESFESSLSRETSLRDDVVFKGSDEPYSELDIDPEIQAEINECIAYADSLRTEGIDARIVVETVAREEEERAIEVAHEMFGDMVQRFHDHTVEIPVYRVHVIKSIRRDQGHKIIATGQQSAIQSERINKLERDNTTLRGMMDVAISSSSVLLGICKSYLLGTTMTMPNTRYGATMTREAVDNLIGHRVAKALEDRDAARNVEPLAKGRDEQGGENGDDYEGENRGVNGNGNDNKKGGGNRNGNCNRNDNGNGRENDYENHNMNLRGFRLVA